MRWSFFSILLLLSGCSHLEPGIITQDNTATPAEPRLLPSRVAVIRDDEAPLYSKAILGISVELDEEFAEYSLMGHSSRGPEVVKNALKNGAQVIIAIGPKSANAAKTHASPAPVIFCLVPRVEDYDLERPNVVGIRLEVPIARQLHLLKALDAKIDRIAVVADVDVSATLVERVKKEAKETGVEIVVAHSKIPSAVAGALANLPMKVDALLLLADPIALNMTSFDAMVDYARMKKIPFLAIDDGFVARGALLSFAIDYGLTGRQAAMLTNKILNESLSLKDMRIVEHEALNVAVNVDVAEHIFEDGSFAHKLLSIAAQQRYGIEAF